MRHRPDDILALAEREARKVLKMPRLTAAERLKAIEIVAKIAAIRHKVSDGGGDGAFFANK
jgi:hypothetical protein